MGNVPRRTQRDQGSVKGQGATQRFLPWYVSAPVPHLIPLYLICVVLQLGLVEVLETEVATLRERLASAGQTSSEQAEKLARSAEKAQATSRTLQAQVEKLETEVRIGI